MQEDVDGLKEIVAGCRDMGTRWCRSGCGAGGAEEDRRISTGVGRRPTRPDVGGRPRRLVL